ncbi:uncharacterized protein LOC117146952 isoform X2 [Drosophila mauritiana]|nr:uncharacterized protein LOC117146952 isoform X2 [Drosophila mauritiana]
MQAMSAQMNRESNISEYPTSPRAGGLPTAVCLLSRNVPNSARNEVKTAFIRYGKSMNELARSARKLYKNARLRSLPLRKPMRGKTNDPDARPLRVPVPSAWAMSERYYPSGKLLAEEEAMSVILLKSVYLFYPSIVFAKNCAKCLNVLFYFICFIQKYIF